MKDEIPELFAPEQSAAPPALTLRDVLTVLFRRKWLILGCFALVAGLAGAALYLLPPSYVSEAKVLVKTEQEGGPAFFSGLAGYRDRRVLRTTRLQLMSRAMGDHVYHPAGPHAQLRNAIMTAKSQDEWLDALEWLYGGNGLD